ncbi:hypothetical protein V8C37DRAFT_110197 [Trichoderma ceciliae]
MFGILEAVAVPHAGVFNTYEELIKDLNGRMEKEGYKIVKARSHRSRMGGADIPGNDIVRCDLVCDRGGRPYKCMATKHKTTTKKTDCPWKAKAVNRKSIGGWVLTISCDQHNHAPGTPEPPTPSEMSEDENDLTELQEMDDGPRPDTQTATAIQLAGISDSTLRLTGDTFHQLKSDYRKMPQPDRLNALAQFQMQIAAIYAVQNEDWQRQRRQEAQDKQHLLVEKGRRQLSAQRQRARRQRRQEDPSQQHPNLDQEAVQHQLQQEAQSSHLQPLMQESHFQLAQNPNPTPVPLPGGMAINTTFAQFGGPPKRIRGHRPSMAAQPDV